MRQFPLGSTLLLTMTTTLFCDPARGQSTIQTVNQWNAARTSAAPNSLGFQLLGGSDLEDRRFLYG